MISVRVSSLGYTKEIAENYEVLVAMDTELVVISFSCFR